MSDIIAYFRVSTRKQGESGLGLEGQQAAVEAYARQTGARILASYREVESGKVAERPQLARALAHAKRNKAVLVVAKFDRLARDVEFTAKLMNSPVDFIAVDNPNASRLTLHILAAVAEDEAERISARTKAALGAYKARGGKLGAELPQCRNLTQEAREKGAKAAGEAVSRAAREAYSDLMPLVIGLRDEGKSLAEIAEQLTADGHETRRGRPWNAVQVMRLLQRAKATA